MSKLTVRIITLAFLLVTSERMAVAGESFTFPATVRLDNFSANASDCTPTYHLTLAGQSTDGVFPGCCGVGPCFYSCPTLNLQISAGQLAGGELELLKPGDICCPVGISFFGYPSCISAYGDIQPCDDSHRPSSLWFTVSLQRNTNSLPVMRWNIKDSAGGNDPQAADESNMKLPADDMSRAICTVINTTETPTFSFVGPDLGCTLSATALGTVLKAGTNVGNVQVLATITNSDACLVRDFFFELTDPKNCQGCNQVAGCDPPQTLLGSIDIRINLGPTRLDSGPAFLQVKSEVPDANLGTPQFLRCDFIRPEVKAVTNANGWVRQVRALDRIIDVVTNSATSYSLLFYESANQFLLTNGLYQLSGTPFRTVTILLVGGDTNTVRVTDSLDSAASDYAWLGSGWALTKGGGLSTETRTITNNGATNTVFRSMKNALNVVQSTNTETWQAFSFGNRLTQEIFGSGSNRRTNNYSYGTNGLLDTVTRGDGSWDIYQYDTVGRQTNHLAAFTNAAPTTNSALCRNIVSTHTNSVVSGSGDDWTLDRFTPRQVTEY